MKNIIFIFLMAAALPALAQSKAERQLLERTYLLSHTVFGSMDSSIMNDLLARQLSYGHSGGKIENREEAFRGITTNRSYYTDTAVTNVQILVADDAAVVRHLFRAKEHKADGTVVPLNFSMVLMWVKEKRKWRLVGRQAVKLV